MTPSEFAAKWKGVTTSERASAQSHFIDLCGMLHVGAPTDLDPSGEWYAFEKGAEKLGGGDGFADVWKRGHFAWEYKGKRKDLRAAYRQLNEYREALENPPLLVVSDMHVFEVHTNFTGTVSEVHRFTLDDLATSPTEPLRVLRALMSDPDALRPQRTREDLTEEAAEQFARIAVALRDRGHEAQAVAHFLDKLLFCLFAEDAGLIPKGLFSRLIDATRTDAAVFMVQLRELFRLMSSQGGGWFGTERVEWFNGNLFDGSEVIPMETREINVLSEVSKLDWSEVEPAIFGTLFERGLDPDRRTQLGAHYTDRDSIERLVEPVLMAPLRRELQQTKSDIATLMGDNPTVSALTPAKRKAVGARFDAFLDRVRSVTVLDPACGSGNFLYICLQSLKDLEREALLWGSLTMHLPIQAPEVGPHQLRGIEINPYAAELTRVTIWIGEIQWMLHNGYGYARDPILKSLDNIETRDALIDWSDPADPREADWPDAEVIIGNPPFLGAKLLRRSLGGAYVGELFRLYGKRLPGMSDFVTYWHEKARTMVEAGRVRRVGLLATQGIRRGRGSEVLTRIKESGDIFLAWSDEPWVLDGAAVHVSFIGFDDGSEGERWLNGVRVASINPNLTTGVDLGTAMRLEGNRGTAFIADVKGGPFEIPEDTAKRMLAAHNPDGRPNSEVVRPWANGLDITRRPRNMWIIDFGLEMSEEEAALYEMPYEHARRHVLPMRSAALTTTKEWWRHERPGHSMRRALAGLERYVATPALAKHRLFVWLPRIVLADHQLVVFARDDDYTFGVLHSRVHELWARGMGTQLREVESGFRYTPTTTFETFPFPPPTESQREAVAAAARSLDELRRGWLDPPGAGEAELKERALTKLYNQRPAWLHDIHERLDAAVLGAYGWPPDIDDGNLLSRLLALNLERAARV